MNKRMLPKDFSFKSLFAPKPPGEIIQGGYPYFAHRDRLPFQVDSVGLSLSNALWFSECSLLVYVEDENLVTQTFEETGSLEVKCFNFQDQGSQAFIK